ncbi:MAG: EAL domain-containing protein [Paracoccaceae bacterium]|nr:EAL domain-containing protein [Paracoccaceae bacterium]
MNIWRSFFILLVVAFIVAVVSGSVAVHVTAKPLLEEIKTKAIETRAEASAEAIARELGRMKRELRILGRDTTVLRGVGEPGGMTPRVQERLRRFATFGELAWLRVYDDRLQGLSETSIDNDPSNFSASEFELLAQRALSSVDATEPRLLYRPAADGQTFLISAPVVREGTVIGALVGEFPFDFGAVLARTDFANTVEITDVAANPGSAGLSVTPIDGTPFFLVIEPNHAALQAMGNELIRSVTAAILAALALPFAVLAVGGRRAIILPHAALAASREELRRSERRLAEFGRVVASANDAIAMANREGVVTWVNRSFVELTGYSAEEIVGRKPGDLLHGPDTDPDTIAFITEEKAAGRRFEVVILHRRKDGSVYWNDMAVTPLVDEAGERYGSFSVSRDITEQRQREAQLLEAKEEIEHKANHDPLTGLPNRRYVDRVLAERRDETKTLIRIDLDHFKHVNDTLGHAAGDHVLCHVAEILRAHVRRGDVPARVGGDEFVVVLGPGYDSRDAEGLALRLRDEIRKEITIAGKRCRIGASFGVASSTDDLLEEKELLACADAALYIAKDKGRSQVVPYTKDVHATILEARTIAGEIEQALARGEFVPVFQPQFDARTHDFTGMETLLRWQHPERGLLGPDTFLSIADQMSVIPDIDAQLFDKALKIVAGLGKDGFWIPKVSFNVTAPRLQDPALVDTYRRAEIGETKVAIELLESVLVEEESSAFFFYLDNLREIGLEIEIDDFGSGHASIIGLGQVQPHAMKIDRRLVIPITESETSRSMVASIVEMARHLGIRVIAEGVESEAHARMLAELGCDVLQGFWFARPLDEAALRHLLTARQAPRTGTVG